MNQTLIYKGYEIIPAPYVLPDGKYSLNGHVRTHGSTGIGDLKHINNKKEIFMSINEAEKAFINLAKEYIDKL